MEETRKDHGTALRLVLIILLGFGIRLTGLEWGQGYSIFGSSDSLEAYSVSVNYALGEPRAAYIGQPNYNERSKLPGPLWALFCFVGQRFWGSIEGAILATIALGTATIYLTCLLARRTLGPAGSLWAALLAATLPFPVYYSAFVFNPNVMPFLGALVFLALWDVVRQDRSRRIFWVVLVLLVMPQFHASVLALVPAVVILLVLSPVRLNIPWLLGGLLAGGLCYLPYVRGEMAHGWQNTLGMTSAKAGHWWGGLKALIAPWNLLVDYVPQWTRSFGEYRLLGNACFGWFGVLLALNLLSAVVALLLLVGAFQKIKETMRGSWRSPRRAFNQSPGVVFLAVLIVVPLVCLLFSGESFHSRYAIALLAPLLSLAGSAIVTWSTHPRVGRFFVVAVIAVTCGNVWFMPAMYWYQGARIERGEVFYSSFRNLESVYQHLKRHAGPKRSVEVDDAAYLNALSLQDKAHREAKLIRRYVIIREKESAALSGGRWVPVTYTMCRADQVLPGDPAVAYVAHDIALFAAPPAQ